MITARLLKTLLVLAVVTGLGALLFHRLHEVRKANRGLDYQLKR